MNNKITKNVIKIFRNVRTESVLNSTNLIDLTDYVRSAGLMCKNGHALLYVAYVCITRHVVVTRDRSVGFVTSDQTEKLLTSWNGNQGGHIIHMPTWVFSSFTYRPSVA